MIMLILILIICGICVFVKSAIDGDIGLGILGAILLGVGLTIPIWGVGI